MRKRGNIIFIFIVIILVMVMGFAYLNSDLNINGITNISNANWNVYWDSLNVTSGSVTDVTTAAHILTGETEVEFNVNFTKPGDFYEFTVDAVNDGTIDAMIDSLTKGVYASNGTTPKTLPDYLTYSVTYSDGIEIQSNHLLSSGKTEKYKVRVEYKTDINSSQLPTTADNYMFKIGVTYKQADSNGVPAVLEPNDFSTDSWATIIRAVKSNNISKYNVGDTKEVDMGTFGTHTLRIANTTTPAECSTTGFSQTACGFVLEFADIITKYNMNSTGTNVGGWSASMMRTYVNSDIYNALPTELKNGIIDTTVVSGHGSTTGETNFTSTDKLYLLSTHEVFEDVDGNASRGPDYYDTAYNNTRQLYYYENAGVTTSNYSGAIKQYNGSNTNWWLRPASSSDNRYFSYTGSGGICTNDLAIDARGVSPAFRIG